MKKILISQRRDSIPNRNEQRDALDVKWGELLRSLGYLPIPLCSGLTNYEVYFDEIDDVAILLSGGNDLGESKERDFMESALLSIAAQKQIPVLGVCRGMQMMNQFLGGSLQTVDGHVAVKHRIYGELCARFGYIDVNSFHNSAVTEKTKSPFLETLAVTEDGVIEAVKHRDLPWYGIMWHPEREVPFQQEDIALIKRAFDGRVI